MTYVFSLFIIALLFANCPSISLIYEVRLQWLQRESPCHAVIPGAASAAGAVSSSVVTRPRTCEHLQHLQHWHSRHVELWRSITETERETGGGSSLEMVRPSWPRCHEPLSLMPWEWGPPVGSCFDDCDTNDATCDTLWSNCVTVTNTAQVTIYQIIITPHPAPAHPTQLPWFLPVTVLQN